MAGDSYSQRCRRYMGVALSSCLIYLSQVACLLCLHIQALARGSYYRSYCKAPFWVFFFIQCEWDNFTSLLISKGAERSVFGLGGTLSSGWYHIPL